MKAKFQSALIIVIAGCFLNCGSGVAVAADGSPQGLKKVAIAYSSISPNQAPAWAAYETGIFRKYGLDVQLIFVESGSRTASGQKLDPQALTAAHRSLPFGTILVIVLSVKLGWFPAVSYMTTFSSIGRFASIITLPILTLEGKRLLGNFLALEGGRR